MTTGRYYQTATLLASGQVLIAGGYSNSGTLSSAELYDATNQTWSSTGHMSTARYYHTATLLTASGDVLMVGGSDGNINLSACELYTGSSFTPTPPATGAPRHTASPMSLRMRSSRSSFSPPSSAGRLSAIGRRSASVAATLSQRRVCSTRTSC